jgi:hypothetical protein
MMHEVCHTKEPHPSHSLPLSLHTLSSLPLWHQASKPKGLKEVGKQTSRSLEDDERPQTDLHR